MNKPAIKTQTPTANLPPLPGWVTQNHGKTPETSAFLSSASLTMLLVDSEDTLPAELLHNRLALCAAEACPKLEGRRESEVDIRDAFFVWCALVMSWVQQERCLRAGVKFRRLD